MCVYVIMRSIQLVRSPYAFFPDTHSKINSPDKREYGLSLPVFTLVPPQSKICYSGPDSHDILDQVYVVQ